MYRLKSKSGNPILGFIAEFIRDFPTKAEAKAAAEDDYGKEIKWKVKHSLNGKKKKITSAKTKGVAYTITKVKTKKAEKEIPQNDEPRTVQDFVEDMISDGRTPGEVMAVAQSCRWKHHLPAIKDVLEEFSKK